MSKTTFKEILKALSCKPSAWQALSSFTLITVRWPSVLLTSHVCRGDTQCETRSRLIFLLPIVISERKGLRIAEGNGKTIMMEWRVAQRCMQSPKVAILILLLLRNTSVALVRAAVKIFFFFFFTFFSCLYFPLGKYAKLGVWLRPQLLTSAASQWPYLSRHSGLARCS